MKTIILSCILLVAFVGCGIKGDPLPPAETETVQKQNTESLQKKEEPATTSDLTTPPTTTKKKKK